MTLLEFHVLISLVEIVAGFVMLYGLLTGRAFGGWTALFLATAVLTSLTGFPLAPFGFDPPRAVGILTLVLLAIAVAAYYLFRLAGAWRWVYVIAAMMALYLDVFVGVIQSFMKIPPLHVLAPTQSEPPFLVAQAVVLGLFVVLGFFAVRKFHPRLAPTA
ncbi:MAG TPA: hypothetical protein VL048_17165 [Xanthobacteraceae bacterium]|nr:hypothetical protein [Xanthobacteraceae bacterium]